MTGSDHSHSDRHDAAEEIDLFETLDCSAVIADVWTMLDNECDDASRARVQRHLDSCSSCLAHYGIEEKVKSLVGRKCGGDKAPDGLRDRLIVELRSSITIISPID